MAIRAVIFDLGGVLFRIHDPTTHRQWEARLGLGEGQLAEIIFNNPVAQRAMVGDATPEQVWVEVRQRLSLRADELQALSRRRSACASLAQRFFGARWRGWT